MEVRVFGEFTPFGEQYLKEHPLLAHSISKFDDIDLSSFSLAETKPWGASTPKQAYHLTSSRDIDNDDEPNSTPLKSRQSSGRARLRGDGEQTFDEELYVAGSTVIWSQGHILKSSYNFEDELEPVLMALFAYFPVEETSAITSASSQYPLDFDIDRSCLIRSNNGKTVIGKAIAAASQLPKRKLQRALCVLLRSTAKIYFPSGLSYTVHLPFIVHRAWALDVGILLQRIPETEELQPSSFGLPDVPPTAVLFSLLDPFDEITMVSKTGQITVAGVQQVNIYEPTNPFTDHNHEVLFVSEGNRLGGTPFVVTFHREQLRHYVWRYATRPEEGDYPKEKTAGRTLRRDPSGLSTAPIAGGVLASSTPSPLLRRNSLTRTNSDTSIVLDRVVHNDNVQSQQDTQMKSVTYLEQVWMETEATRNLAAGSSVFIAHNIKGSEVLCIFKKSQRILVGLDILRDNTGVKITKAFQREAIAAVPVCATRQNLCDILLLQPDGAMQLWIGLQDVWIPCTMPNDFHAMHETDTKSTKRRRGSWTEEREPSSRHLPVAPKHILEPRSLFRSPSRAFRVVDIKDAVDNRFNIVLSSDTVFRVFVNFVPRSMLVRSCIAALSYAMPSDLFFNFHVRFLEYEYGHEAKYGNSFPSGDEWEDFVVILLSFCHPAAGAVNVVTTNIAEDEDKDDWEFLLSSEHHQRALKDPTLCVLNKNLKDNALSARVDSTLIKWFAKSKEVFLRYHKQLGLFDYIPSVLLALHLVCEDLKLSVITQKFVSDLSPILVLLVQFLNWDTWIDYYARQGNDIVPSQLVGGLQLDTESKYDSLKSTPPDIHGWIYDRVRQRSPASFPKVSHISRLVGFTANDIFREFSCCEQTRKICSFYAALTNPNRGPEAVILEMSREGFRLCDLHNVPFGVALPLREAIRRCRNAPPGNWPGETYVLIGREDLAEQITGAPTPVLNVGTSEESKLTQPKDIQTIAQFDLSMEVASSVDDGMKFTSEVTDLRFGMDLRIEEVRRLLQSANLVKLRVAEKPELSEQELAIEHQGHVTALSYRTLSLPVGRGIFTMGTSTGVLMESFPIPGFDLSAKMLPLNVVVNLDMHAQQHDLLDWAGFHDGVAAGLRISSDCDITGSWILYNKPDELNPQHAGFLLALGLSGHIRQVVSVEWYKYLAQKHDLVSIGLLLGLSSAYCGSMDGKVTRLLSIHIPALLPPNSTELYHSALTQTTCVLGMGLLYMGTSHRRMTEVMLAEIGKRELNSSEAISMHKESYSLAAGFALGFITLGRGNEAMGLADLHIKDELRRYIIGGKDEGFRKAGSELKPQASQPRGWKENENINVNVTSPGATIALGLMFLKTNKLDVANKIDIPDTMVLLDYVRPDFLLLRILSRNLIMWGGIKPNKNWVEGQVPLFMKEILNEQEDDSEDPNIESVRQAYYHIVAGACFSVAIRYAGSADERAFRCLLSYLDYFVGLSGTPATTYEEKVTRTAVKSCLDVLATSVAIVMAGTGNLEVLRRLRKLHGRISFDVTYGSHMACHMAIGFLFLGAGNYTLGTSNKAVAALICALFPRFPTSPNDNRSHLQAFRHLWVLAVEPRCLVPRDVETRKACYIPMTLTLYEEDGDESHHQRPTKDISVVAPYLLPDFKSIKMIKVNSPRYWPITLDLAKNRAHLKSLISTRTLYVKRKTGHLSYQEDPKGFRSIFARSFPNNLVTDELSVERQLRNKEEFVKSFSADPQILAFAKYMCNITAESDRSSRLASFCTSILHECLTADKPEAIQTYLSLYQGQETLQANPNVLTMWNIKLVLAYYEQASLMIVHRGEDKHESLIREAFVESMRQEMNTLLRTTGQRHSRDHNAQLLASLNHYFKSFQFPASSSAADSRHLALVGLYLIYNDVPGPDKLRKLSQLVKSTVSELSGQAGLEEVGIIGIMLKSVLSDSRWDVIEEIQRAMLR